MTSLTYNLTRQQAARLLGISTRTLDRRIRKGKLSYKKEWNKVLLAEEEVLKLKQQPEISTTYEWHIVSDNDNNVSSSNSSLAIYEDIKQIENILSESMERFLKLLAEKDKIIEEKNAIIFSLQHKIWEYESRLKNMIALPDYTKEKENLLLEKEKIELENKYLMDQLKKEKIQKIVLFLFLIVLLLVLFLFWINL